MDWGRLDSLYLNPATWNSEQFFSFHNIDRCESKWLLLILSFSESGRQCNEIDNWPSCGSF